MLPISPVPTAALDAPIVLDLFCCAGGAALGYARAGFRVFGVDIATQPNYPYPFLRMDALEALRRLRDGGTLVFLELVVGALGQRSHVEHRLSLADVAFIHASPPCQASSALTKGTNAATRAHLHIDLIPDTRFLLTEVAHQLRDRDGRELSWVIENVVGSELRRDLTLCGLCFGLRVFRHRYFEFDDAARAPHIDHPSHRGHRVSGWRHGKRYDGDMVAVYGEGGGKGDLETWRAAMGLPSNPDATPGTGPTTRLEIAESIPPAYTEFIGEHLLASGILTA